MTAVGMLAAGMTILGSGHAGHPAPAVRAAHLTDQLQQGQTYTLSMGVNCLDSNRMNTNWNGNSNGWSQVYADPCGSGNQNQEWTYSEGRIVDVATGFCLDSGNTGGVYMLPCAAGDQYQLWTTTSAGSGNTYLTDFQTGRVLTYNNSGTPFALGDVETSLPPTVGTYPDVWTISPVS